MVDVADSRADVAAFDTIIVPPRGALCPDGVNEFHHAARVTFQRAGESAVVVRGLRPGSPRDTIRYSFNVTVTN